MKIAICFFGLTRSLKYTISSINKNLFNVLKNENYEYTIFLHTYNLTKLVNKRTGENDILNVDEYKLLSPDYFEITDQNIFDNTVDINKYNKNGYSLTYTDETIMNIHRQNNSIMKVWNLVNQIETNFDFYIMCRPDIELLFPIILPTIIPKTLYIPNFAHYGGFNDRFCIGDKYSVSVWSSRLNYIDQYCENNILQSEQLLKYVLKCNNVNVKLLSALFRFRRIRTNGKIEKN
jgi:hypothetical protein